MAQVRITRRYPDGDTVEVVVFADDTYPDAMDEARAVAQRGFVDAIGAVESTFVADETEEG